MSRILIPLITVTTMTDRIEEETLEPGAAVQAKADTEAEADHPTGRPMDPMDHQEMMMKVTQGVKGRKDVRVNGNPTDLLLLTHLILVTGMMVTLEMVIGV